MSRQTQAQILTEVLIELQEIKRSLPNGEMVLIKKSCKDGWTALTSASAKGHLDVVNRLLDFKQIDVNAQTKVSWNVDCKKTVFSNSNFLFFCLDVVVKYIVEW